MLKTIYFGRNKIALPLNAPRGYGLHVQYNFAINHVTPCWIGMLLKPAKRTDLPQMFFSFT